MDKPIWIGSQADIRYGDKASEALQIENDAQYWQEDRGIIRVDQARWERAQQYESEAWMKYNLSSCSDRDEDHIKLFDNYRVLPTNLGNLLEIGCGPFTQTRVVLQTRIALSITLLDPLLNTYKSHPNCYYNKLQPQPTLLSIPAEDLNTKSAFDTIVCINVLEHVRDAELVLSNIKEAAKPGAILVMGERTYDDLDVNKIYDVGHPIRIKSSVLEEFKADLNILYSNGDYFIGNIKV